MRKVYILFILNTFLFASSYSVSKEALGRIDAIVFTFFMMVALVPAGICILALSWQDITREAVKSGFVLGSCLCLGLFMIYISLKYNTATGTAFFPSLNGFLAALMTWLFLRQPITRATWWAGLLSVVGALVIIANSPMGAARGALIAFIGGLFCTFYVFLADHEQQPDSAQWPLLGVQLLTMAAWACLVALLFGNWSAVHPQVPKDIGVILYIGVACTFLPTLITVLAQKYIAPLTVAFIYILEPILGAIIAFFYLHETLPLAGYAGGALVIVGAFVQTLGTRPELNRSVYTPTQQAPALAYRLDTRKLRRLADVSRGAIPLTSERDAFRQRRTGRLLRLTQKRGPLVWQRSERSTEYREAPCSPVHATFAERAEGGRQ